jgi:hypothetical protein
MLKESRLMELMAPDFRKCRGRGASRRVRIAVPLAMLASLSACGYLSGGAEDPGQPKKDSILENIMMGGARPKASATPQVPAPQARFPDAVTEQNDFECPVLDVAANGATLRDFAGGNDSAALRHQISITRLGRECKDAGTNIAMKLGVEGSVLLGPSGSPGTFKVPLVFEARLNDKVVASRSETVSVTIPPNEERAFYSTVLADFVIPKDDNVDVYVGLNQGGGAKLAPPKERRHRKRR